MLIIFFVILASCCFLAYADVNNSLKYLLVIGFTQDLFRKSIVGEPPLLIVTVGFVFATILMCIWLRKGFYYSFEPFSRWGQKIQTALIVFLAILFLQFLHSFLRYGNFIIGLIGFITYIAPFLAVVVGYYFANNSESIRRFLQIYILAGLVVAVSVVLSFLGYEWRILQEVGVGITIYDQGTILESYSGIMRTGELAAWHVSTTACLIMTLALSSTKKVNFIIVGAIVVLLMIVVALTGRRKMLMLLSLFIFLYAVSYMFYLKKLDAKYFFGIFYTGLIIWLGFETINLADYSESLKNYLARGSSVYGDAGQRFIQLGLSPIQWAYNRVGLLGGGLGIASQGSHLFNVANVAGGAGEGGLGKIMVELGLPGLLCIIWLIWVMAKYVHANLKLACLPYLDEKLLSLMLCLTVFIAVNGLTFSVATQLYSDVFVLLMLGLFGGFIFAIPKIVIQEINLSKRQRSALNSNNNMISN